MNDADREMIARLVREGTQIKQVWEERFPQYSYYDVYWAANGGGARSALGTQRIISRRLQKLEAATKAERKALIEEIADLVWQQYQTIKSNAATLKRIRDALGE